MENKRTNTKNRKKHLPKIVIYPIKHSQQRYDTAGDYFKDFGGKNLWWFHISKMENPDYEFLVLIHELIEWYLTQKRGIKEKDITLFDLKNVDSEDPGSLKDAPYHREHMFSMKIEKLLAKELGVEWKTYDKSFDKLVYEKRLKNADKKR